MSQTMQQNVSNIVGVVQNRKSSKQHDEIRLSGGRKNFGVVSNENNLLFDTTKNDR